MIKDTTSPCKDCDKRHENCHSKCKAYKTWHHNLIKLRKKGNFNIRTWDYD